MTASTADGDAAVWDSDVPVAVHGRLVRRLGRPREDVLTAGPLRRRGGRGGPGAKLEHELAKRRLLKTIRGGVFPLLEDAAEAVHPHPELAEPRPRRHRVEGARDGLERLLDRLSRRGARAFFLIAPWPQGEEASTRFPSRLAREHAIAGDSGRLTRRRERPGRPRAPRRTRVCGSTHGIFSYPLHPFVTKRLGSLALESFSRRRAWRGAFCGCLKADGGGDPTRNRARFCARRRLRALSTAPQLASWARRPPPQSA
jgi:hypothetical protein